MTRAKKRVCDARMRFIDVGSHYDVWNLVEEWMLFEVMPVGKGLEYDRRMFSNKAMRIHTVLSVPHSQLLLPFLFLRPI